MVIGPLMLNLRTNVAAVNGWIATWLTAETSPVLERLDPPRRAAVVMALMGLVLTGLVLVACVMLGSHWVRRLARHRPNGASPSAGMRSTAGSMRTRKSLQSMLPDEKTGDTVQIDDSTKETKVDRGK